MQSMRKLMKLFIIIDINRIASEFSFAVVFTHEFYVR